MGEDGMELHHLRYFVAVARHLSFTKAASENHVAQPSLSQQIQRFEQQLGAQLFDRSGGQVRMTDVGLMLQPRAESVLKQIDDMRFSVEEVQGLRAGRLVVGTLPMTGGRVLPAAVSEFRRRFPGIQVVLREESTATLTDLVLRGETDITLTTLPVENPELGVQPILTEDILLALPPGHALGSQPGVALSELAGEPFMIMKPGFGFRDLCLRACRSAGFEPVIAYESAHIETILSMVANGLGVALVPRMATDQVRRPAPHFLEIIAPRVERTLALVWRHDRYLSVAGRAFLEVARSIWPGR